MRALVTGGAGFIGRHMMTELTRRGWHVVGVDLRDGPYTTGVLVKADVREVFAGRLMHHDRFDLIVHCAYHVARNLELDAQLFEWSVRTRQPRVLYYSSSAAYPIEHQQADQWMRLVEDHIDLGDARQPDARYGWAKLTGERLATAAALSGLRVHVLRPFSGYGGDQDLTYPFPAILDRVRHGDLTVWGPPGQYRDWVHIDDVVGCSIAVVEKDITGPVNVCSGIGIEMGDLAVRMAKIAGMPVLEHPRYLIDRPTGVMVRIGDPSRMQTIYRPTVGLEEGIRRALGGTP